MANRLFETTSLAERPVVIAPDGCEVRPLPDLKGGGFAHFMLEPGKVSKAVAHKTVEEIWYVIAGKGEMWRANGEADAIVTLEPGVCLTIPLGTRFQFRSTGHGPLEAVAVTMPPWPGDGEAVVVDGKWSPEL